MKTAVCLIVRNEVESIQEWIAFHALAGFDTQIIFDNGSEDGTAALIQQAARHYDIRFHDWQNRSAASQTLAYEAACQAYRLEFDWIAFIDSDEYFVTEEDLPVNTLLARYDGWAAVAVNWAIYGANGHETAPDGLIVEAYTRRAEADFFPNRHVKSIIRPRLAQGFPNPHYFTMAEDIDGHYCDPSGAYMLWLRAPEAPGGTMRGMSRALPDWSVCRVNHYFTRSRAHWQAKLRRGYPADFVQRSAEEFTLYDRNEALDPIAARRAAAVREAVLRLRAG